MPMSNPRLVRLIGTTWTQITMPNSCDPKGITNWKGDTLVGGVAGWDDPELLHIYRIEADHSLSQLGGTISLPYGTTLWGSCKVGTDWYVLLLYGSTNTIYKYNGTSWSLFSSVGNFSCTCIHIVNGVFYLSRGATTSSPVYSNGTPGGTTFTQITVMGTSNTSVAVCSISGHDRLYTIQRTGGNSITDQYKLIRYDPDLDEAIEVYDIRPNITNCYGLYSVDLIPNIGTGTFMLVFATYYNDVASEVRNTTFKLTLTEE
jgi:hypothetical protein